MDEQRLGHLLGQAADFETEPVPDVAGLVRRGRRARTLRRAQRVGGVAAVALLIGVAVAAADSGDPESDVATVDSPAAPDERNWPDPAEPDAVDPAETTTTTTAGEGATEQGGTTTSTTAPADPGPPQMVVSPSTLQPFGKLSVRSADPCPAGASLVDVVALAVGGTMDGQIVGGGPVAVEPDGRWSTSFGVAAVGGIENVAWAMTAPQLEVRSECGAGRVSMATYAPVRLRHGRVTVVPQITATWDGQTATVEFSGCPFPSEALLTWGDAPPPLGQAFSGPYASGSASPGTEAGTWVATIDLPGYDPADGLWASAGCRESSGVTDIWRYLPFELDPPG